MKKKGNCSKQFWKCWKWYGIHGSIGGIHKLREQGRGREVVLKMFTLVHKGEEGGSANVHVGLNCKYFK
jgi:hypothetical protein